MNPTDEYGFGAAAYAGLQMFECMSRQTGRTMRMIERVQNGDQIICCTVEEQKRLMRLFREAGKDNVRVHVVDPRRVPMETVGTTPNGRAFFDHEWVMRFFERRLREAANDMDRYMAAMSKTWPEAPPAPEDPRVEHMTRQWVRSWEDK